jgi:hypothetical protein
MGLPAFQHPSTAPTTDVLAAGKEDAADFRLMKRPRPAPRGGRGAFHFRPRP